MTWIDSDSAFNEWCQEAATHDVIAMDTEFVWTKTFYAELGLLQMAWDRDHPALVDVLAITDTTPLTRLLEDPRVVKVFHEAASDLPILHRWTQGALPQNIFDTRIAGGFTGLTASLSLNKLLTVILGITLPKTETRTNWLQRPLTPAQIDYASGDVDYMPELYRQLEERLIANHNEPWFRIVMSTYSTPDYYEEPPVENAWKRVSNNGHFNGRDLAVLVELATWRETYARTHNISRNRIITDEQIGACAQYHPATIGDLMHKAAIWRKNADLYGEAILQAIQRGLTTTGPLPTHGFNPHRLDDKILRARTQRLKKLVAKRAEERQIDPVLVAARREMESFIYAVEEHGGNIDHDLLTGWKRELLGDTIQQLADTNFNL